MQLFTLPSLAKAGLLSSLLLLAAPCWGQTAPPTGTLVKRVTSTGTTPAQDGSSGGEIKVDASGNVYVTGDFYGAVDLGGITLSSPNGYDSYLAKYSPTGTLLWAQQLDGANYETVEPKLALDAAGNAYLTGSFYGALNIGGTTLTDPAYNSSSFSLNGYVAKFNAQGTLQWAQRLGAAASTTQGSAGGTALAVDVAGNVVMSAWFAGTVTLGTSTLTSITTFDGAGNPYGSQDVLVAKLTPQGTVLWARHDGSQQGEDARALTTDAQGNIYIGGSFESSITFGSITVSGNATDDDAYLAKYDATGAPQWATRVPAALANLGNDQIQSLSADASGNISVLGRVEDPSFPSTGNGFRTYLARYSPQGTLAWSQISAGAGDSYAGAIVHDAAGNLYLCGTFVDGFTLGSLALNTPGAGDVNIFLISLTPQGALRWSLQSGGPGDMGANGLAFDTSGQLFVAGTAEGTTSLAGLTLNPNGPNFESFFARLTNVVTSTRPGQTLPALALYPNPTRAAATIALPAQLGAGQVTVRDLTGRLIQQVPFPAAARQVPLPLRGVSAGLYTVQVVTEAGFSPLARLVVQ